MSDKLVFEVKQSHIDEAKKRRLAGVQSILERHPVVLALEEHGHKEVLVGEEWARVGDETYRLCELTKSFVHHWINQDEVCPITSTLTTWWSKL